MPTKFTTSQHDEQGEFEVPSSSSDSNSSANVGSKSFSTPLTNYASESTEVPEVAGTNDASSHESSEAILGGPDDNHTPMNSPSQSTESSSQPTESTSGEEAAGTESEFENVEGWTPPTTNESDDGNETLIEASFADTNATNGNQEFFGALVGVLAPLASKIAHVVAPTVISAGRKAIGGLVSKGAKKLSPTIRNVANRLKSFGHTIPTSILSKFETSSDEEFGDNESAAVNEAALEALQQQLAALEVVIGTDDRVQVTATKDVPWKRICHLKIQTKTGKSYLGTGFFVGPRTIITAGHCVFIQGQGGWAKSIVVTPGRNEAATPFNTFTATKFRSVKGWVMNNDRNYDYAAIILDKSANVSPEIGAFGFGNYANDVLLNKHLSTAGYPGDKPAGTMWFNGRKAKSVTDRTITYDIDTAGGQSGSAVWFKATDGTRMVVGIHTNGVSTGNSATRITKPVFENLKRWRTEGGNTL